MDATFPPSDSKEKEGYIYNGVEYMRHPATPATPFAGGLMTPNHRTEYVLLWLRMADLYARMRREMGIAEFRRFISEQGPTTWKEAEDVRMWAETAGALTGQGIEELIKRLEAGR